MPNELTKPSMASRWDVDPIDDDAPPVEAPRPGQEVSTLAAGVFVPTPDGETTARVTRRAGGRHAFTWLSAHGGAGATSLAAGSGAGADLTATWPDPALGWPGTVALVCRSNAAGLNAAAQLIQEAASGAVQNVEVVALVVVADAPGRLPKALRHRIHELGGLVATVVDVPWVSEWRETPYTPHQSAASAAATISAALHPSTDQ